MPDHVRLGIKDEGRKMERSKGAAIEKLSFPQRMWDSWILKMPVRKTNGLKVEVTVLASKPLKGAIHCLCLRIEASRSQGLAFQTPWSQVFETHCLAQSPRPQAPLVCGMC